MKWSKIASTMFLLTVLCASTVAINARQVSAQILTTLRVSPERVDVEVCTEFYVDVFVDTDIPVARWGIILVYDTVIMDGLDVQTLIPFVLVNRIVDDVNGFMLVEGMGGPLVGTFGLARFTFHCTGVGGSAMRIADCYLLDPSQTWIPVEKIVDGYAAQWFFKSAYVDYAPSGVPDFDQRQDNWVNPITQKWSWCGPIAVANSFWWMDSRLEPHPFSPPKVNDGYQLVTSWDSWDDHDSKNLQPFANNLAWLMDTDGMRTGYPHEGTTVWDMQAGIDQYLNQQGLTGKFTEQTVPMPTYEFVAQEVEKCEDVILLLGFWQFDGQSWHRVGGHYVTVAGVEPAERMLAISDPILNNAEPPPEGSSGPGRVLPGPHGPPYPHATSLHNDTLFVSHDFYAAGSSPSPGNPAFGLPDYPYYYYVENFAGQNFDPHELTPFNPLLPVSVEVEFAVTFSCKTGFVAAGSEDMNVYVLDFFGILQWQWNLQIPVVSVAMDVEGRYVAAGARTSMLPATGALWLFDNTLGPPPGNILFMIPSLPVSTSYDGGWGGTESKSVDVKYNAYNGYVVVAAATDNGLFLFDQLGNLIWNYGDQYPETIVRISQDGNYIVCADYNSGYVHYFSHLCDGVPGWGPNDVVPMWSFGGPTNQMYGFWTAISGMGDYVAVSVYPQPVQMGPFPSGVVLLDKTGAIVWFYALPKPGYVRVDMPCDGRSVVSVNDDPSDSFGCDLDYWSDMADLVFGWSALDGVPVWTYWPGKETGGQQNPLDDFYTVAISENGDNIATGGVPRNTYVLKNDGSMQQIVGLMPSSVQSVDLTFSGKYGASGDMAGNIWFFDNATGFKWAWAAGGAIHSIAVSKLYPCMYPYPDHDVAVVNFTTCKDGCLPMPTVGQGYTAHINVTVLNEGDYAETFEVKVYANTTILIGSAMVIGLAVGAETTLTFIWNTTGFAKGNYVLGAHASIVHDEIDVEDNTRILGEIIRVVTPGNVNADNIVNMRDISTCCTAFMATPGTPKWNPNADINDDHIVNMRDISIACANFMKPDP